MPLNTSTRARADGPDMLWAARMEMIVVVWRICEALKAGPPRTDPQWVARWNHGVARELVRQHSDCDCSTTNRVDTITQWRAIDAMGVAEAANYVGQDLGYVAPGPRRNSALLILLRHAKWVDRAIQFDVLKFAAATFLAGCHLPSELCGQFDQAFGSARWWLWTNDGPPDSVAPGWWSDPSTCVVRCLAASDGSRGG